MPHAQLAETVRLLVADVFSQLRLGTGSEPVEMILIRDGAYSGRRFEVADGHAVWTCDEDRLQVFRSDGSVLRVIDHISGLESAVRKAA